MGTYHENLRATITDILYTLQHASKPIQTDSPASAAQIQIASNAIVRVAGDIGSAYQILEASSLNSDLFNLSKLCYDCINSTAYVAERLAMQAMQIEMNGPEKPLTAPAAYQLANKQLNLGLSITPLTADDLTIRFEPYNTAFASKPGVNDPLYPIKSYYLVMVKAGKDIPANSMDDFYSNPLVVAPGQNIATVTLSVKEMRDSDNETIKNDQPYTALLFAQFSEYYKKMRNNFEDYLSAPAAPYSPVFLAKQHTLSGNCKVLADKLIYSTELIQKLSGLINRTKAVNPLVSDELISTINSASTNAGRAVALTMDALRSTYNNLR